MTEKRKHDTDGAAHSKPGSVDQQMEDTFPASDAPFPAQWDPKLGIHVT